MTTYRHPFDRKKQPDSMTKPPLPVWIDNGLKIYHKKTRSQKHSIDYWLGMYMATPAWLNDAQVAEMKALYNSCVGDIDHVDHIVPLNNDLVCGLNVPWNLQRMGVKANIKKSNHFWPDCPFQTFDLFDSQSAFQQTLI